MTVPIFGAIKHFNYSTHIAFFEVSDARLIDYSVG